MTTHQYMVGIRSVGDHVSTCLRERACSVANWPRCNSLRSSCMQMVCTCYLRMTMSTGVDDAEADASTQRGFRLTHRQVWGERYVQQHRHMLGLDNTWLRTALSDGAVLV
jgi:hypothetical protein